MTTKEKILSIRLNEKIKRNKSYSDKLGLMYETNNSINEKASTCNLKERN